MTLKIKLRIPSLLIFFILLYPKCLDYLPESIGVIRIIYALQIILFSYFIFDLFILKKKNLSKETWILLCLFTVFNLTYVIADLNARVLEQTLTINLRRYLVMVGMLAYVDGKDQKRKIELLNSLFYYLTIIIVINLLCDIFFTNGIAKISMYSDEGYLTWSDSVGFLDADNRVSLFCLLYYYVANMYAKLKKCNKKNIIIMSYVLIFFNIVISRSGSGIIALSVLIICQLLIRYKRIWSALLSWRGIVIVGTFIGLFVAGKFSALVVILGKVFNKGISLSGRTVIWIKAIEKITKSPILGYGTLEGGAFFKVGTYTWYAHDQYLDLWLQGGIFCLLLFVNIIVFLNKRIKLSYIIENYKYFVCTMVPFLTMGIVEHFILRNYYQFWLFICISFALRSVNEGGLQNEK